MSRLRPTQVGLVVVVLGLLPALVGLLVLARYVAGDRVERQDSDLAQRLNVERNAIEAYFERARSVTLLSAQNPAFRDFYRAPGARADKVRTGGDAIRGATAALGYLETLYPDSIGEACFIDASGAENARVVRGAVAPTADLSPDETDAPFFRGSFAQKPGRVYQAAPYVSEDTGEWVISNATPVVVGGRKVAIVHFEVTVESFRRAAAAASGGARIQVYDRASGALVFDSDTPQRAGEPLGGTSARGATFVRDGAGTITVDGERIVYGALVAAPGNANDWVVVVRAPVAAGLPVWSLAVPLLLLALALGGVGDLITRRRARIVDALDAARDRELQVTLTAGQAAEAARRESLQRVVAEYRGFAARVADGDLTARISGDGEGELATLSADFNRMVESLAQVARGVSDASARIYESSARIDTLVTEHTAATAQQAAALDEASLVAGEVRQGAERSAARAHEIQEAAADAIAVSGDGRRVVDEIVTGMNDMRSSVSQIVDDVRDLSAELGAIERITHVVNEIADQSNLLALNANIEAARAGAEGRSFAVVADQVRVLAAQSKAATADVEAILARVQQRMATVTMAAAAGVTAVDAGYGRADDIAAAIGGIADTLRRTAESSTEIASIVRGQHAHANEIAHAIDGIASATTQLTTGASVAQESAHRLRRLADELASLTARYRIDETGVTVGESTWTPVVAQAPQQRSAPALP